MFIIGFTHGDDFRILEIVREDIDEHDKRIMNAEMFEGRDFMMGLPLAKMEDVYCV